MRRPGDTTTLPYRCHREGYGRGRLQCSSREECKKPGTPFGKYVDSPFLRLVLGIGVPQASAVRVKSSHPASAYAHKGHTAKSRRRTASHPCPRERRNSRTRQLQRRTVGNSTCCIHISTTYIYGLIQVLLIDPGQFRVLNDLLHKECAGRGGLETLTFATTAGGDAAATV